MLKSLVKQLPHPLLLRSYHTFYRGQQHILALQLARATRLPLLDTLRLSPVKKSSTVFILGSGWSINEIPNSRWDIIARHDTIGFNLWPVHPFVPRIFVFENLCTGLQPDLYRAFSSIIQRRAQDYVKTVKIATEPHSPPKRQLLHELPPDFRKNLYVGYSVPVTARTDEELEMGLRFLRSNGVFEVGEHVAWLFKYGGSVTAILSLAVRMGYKRIVLCGIDLGKQEYFYHHTERYPHSADWEFAPRKDIHLTARRLPWLVPAQQVIYAFKRIIVDAAGIELFVENRSSTLFPKIAEMPSHTWDTLGSSTA